MPVDGFWDSGAAGLLIRGVFAAKLRAARRIVDGTTPDPALAQRSCLRGILETNAETTYGRRHSFASLDSPSAFQEAVPLITYEDIRSVVGTIADGSDPHALTRDPVIAFSTSSGTTSRPKLVPITKGAIRQEKRVKEAYAAYLVCDHPQILDGKWFYLFNRTDVGRTAAGLDYGSNAGYMFVTTPSIFKKRFFTLPYDVCLIDDYESRYYTILRFALAADLRYLICINPFSSLLIARYIDAWKEDLLRDLSDGGLKAGLELSREQYAMFRALLRPDPAKAARLERAAGRGRLEPLDYWPNLRVTSSWKTGHSRFFADRISDWYPGVTVREIGYGSSEFRTGLVLSDDGSRNIPVPDNYFYEFIPLADEEAYRTGRRRPLLLHELDQGAKYHLIQTGIHGLYRYEVQDIIAINGRHGETPTIEFVQKSGSFTSVSGERLYEFQVNDAVSGVAASDRSLAPVFFVAYADSADRRYRVVAEFRASRGDVDTDRFRRLLDEGLGRECPAYGEARVAGDIGDPCLHVLDAGQGDAYVRWVSERALYDMQAKIHRLKPDYRDDFAFFGIARQPA
jgi:hypothetical protein